MKLKSLSFQKLKERNILCAFIIGLVFALLSLFELLMADASVFFNAKTVSEFSVFETVDTNCKQLDSNTFEISKEKSYIIIPVKEKYNKLDISFDNKSDLDAISDIKIWYCRGKGSWESYNTVSVQLEDGEDNASVSFPEVESGKIKISFRGETGKILKIQSLSFLLNKLFVSKISILKMCIMAVFFTIVFGAIALYILNHRDNRVLLFLGIIFLGEVFFVINNYFSNNFYLAGYLYPDPDDSFMDYFNMLALLNNKNPYYLNASYPALCFVILKFFHNFLPADIAIIEKGKELRANYIAMLGFLILFVISLVLIVAVIKRILNSGYKSLYAIIILLSGPIIFTLQRGNLLLIALLFLLVYILFYDSEDVKERYIAYVALAIAASIKIYPALFGLMTLRKKRYKETIHLAIIGILGFLIPFFAFSGFDTLKEMLHGLQVANAELTCQGAGHNFSLVNLAAITSAFWGQTVTISKLASAAITVILIAVAYLAKKEWQSLFLIATACVWFPEFSFTYVLVFYLPAALFLIKDNNECDSNDYFDIVMLALLQVPFALPYMKWIDKFLRIGKYYHHMSYSTLIPNIIIIIMVVKIFYSVITVRLNIKVNHRRTAIVSIVLCCVMLTVIGITRNRAADNKYDFEGKGTRKSPYLIQNVEDFSKLHDLVNEGTSFEKVYFSQTNNIEFNGETPYSPIGDRSTGKEFAGIYNGNGYTISNYCVTSDEGAGVFGLLTGTIYNMQFSTCNIRGGITGGIAYEVGNEGKIVNCSINGIIFGYKVSGLAAYNNGIIENSAAFVAVESPDGWDTQEYGIAETTYSQSTINCFSNLGQDTYLFDAVDEAALVKLNSHVKNNNANFKKEYKLVDWDISDGYFKLAQ